MRVMLPPDAATETKGSVVKVTVVESTRLSQVPPTIEKDVSRTKGRHDSLIEPAKVFHSANSVELGLSIADEVHLPHPKLRTTRALDGTQPSSFNLPDKRSAKLLRNLRYISFNVYRRLFTAVFAANALYLVVAFARNRGASSLALTNVSTAASANIFVAVLVRQDYFINLLFKACWLIPHHLPLRIRCIVARSYEYGGIHSGAAVAGTMWFALLTVQMTIRFMQNTLRSWPVLVTAYSLLLLLIAIIVFAYPSLRHRSHNAFEYLHRYAGWSAVALLWIQFICLGYALHTATLNVRDLLVQQPSFWFLIAITLNIAWPWIRLRRVSVVIEKLSSHAVRLHFPTKLTPFSGYSISDTPLREWHPFATFPDEDGPGSSILVSNAGDWTQKTVAEPQAHYWVRGVPKPGVLSLACLFRSVLVVATGSGIGPCLAFTADPWRKLPCRLLWSTLSPLETYGDKVYKLVRQIDSEAVIIDTRQSGRPNMVQLAYQLYMESKAEAIFVISNARLTKRVVYAMESRGVPAFGPIWDS